MSFLLPLINGLGAIERWLGLLNSMHVPAPVRVVFNRGASPPPHLHFPSPPESISDLSPLQVPGTQYYKSYLHAFAQTVPAQKGNPTEATGIFLSDTLWVELGTEGTALPWAGLGLMVRQ